MDEHVDAAVSVTAGESGRPGLHQLATRLCTYADARGMCSYMQTFKLISPQAIAVDRIRLMQPAQRSGASTNSTPEAAASASVGRGAPRPWNHAIGPPRWATDAAGVADASLGASGDGRGASPAGGCRYRNVALLAPGGSCSCKQQNQARSQNSNRSPLRCSGFACDLLWARGVRTSSISCSSMPAL